MDLLGKSPFLLEMQFRKCNIFVAVEPQGEQRTTQVTTHRGKVDFVRFVQHLISRVYRSAHRIHFVVDNLNTHFKSCSSKPWAPRPRTTCCGG